MQKKKYEWNAHHLRDTSRVEVLLWASPESVIGMYRLSCSICYAPIRTFRRYVSVLNILSLFIVFALYVKSFYLVVFYF